MRCITHNLKYLIPTALGLVTVTVYNWLCWCRDQALTRRVLTKQTPVPALPHTPKVSALVAAWNEGAYIDAHIQSFLKLSYPDIELVLCAGGDDDTLTRAQSYANECIKVLKQYPGEGKQCALARCMDFASGKIIYLTDADCIFNNEALTHLLAAITIDHEQVATGCSAPLSSQRRQLLPFYAWAGELIANAQRPVYANGLLGRNTALTRIAIEQIGGMDFVAPTGTDYHLAQRLIAAGIAIRFVAVSVVASIYPETIGSYWNQQIRWMRNLLVGGIHYRAYHHIRAALISGAIGAGMLLGMVAVLLQRRAAGMIWLFLFTHALLARVRYALFVQHVTGLALPPNYLICLPGLTITDFAIWTIALFQSLSARSRTRW